MTPGSQTVLLAAQLSPLDLPTPITFLFGCQLHFHRSTVFHLNLGIERPCGASGSKFEGRSIAGDSLVAKPSPANLQIAGKPRRTAGHSFRSFDIDELICR